MCATKREKRQHLTSIPWPRLQSPKSKTAEPSTKADPVQIALERDHKSWKMAIFWPWFYGETINSGLGLGLSARARHLHGTQGFGKDSYVKNDVFQKYSKPGSKTYFFLKKWVYLVTFWGANCHTPTYAWNIKTPRFARWDINPTPQNPEGRLAQHALILEFPSAIFSHPYVRYE